MTDKPDGKRWGWGTMAWIVVAVFVLYPLSFGPATRLSVMSKSKAVEWYCCSGCFPLNQLARHRVPGRLIVGYINLWLWLPGRPVAEAVYDPEFGVALEVDSE